MREEMRQIVEVVNSHPKTSTIISASIAWINAHWLDYGEPIVKALTSVIGLLVLFLLGIKHFLDIKKEHFSNEDE